MWWHWLPTDGVLWMQLWVAATLAVHTHTKPVSLIRSGHNPKQAVWFHYLILIILNIVKVIHYLYVFSAENMNNCGLQKCVMRQLATMLLCLCLEMWPESPITRQGVFTQWQPGSLSPLLGWVFWSRPHCRSPPQCSPLSSDPQNSPLNTEIKRM